MSAPAETALAESGIAQTDPDLQPDPDDRAALAAFYARVRADSEALAAPLHAEDMVVQTMDDVSPTKWHLAHTSWFFETFLLRPHAVGYAPLNDAYNYLFNSYYNAVGAQFPRPRRGLLSRPTVAEVLAYRAHVDEAMIRLIDSAASRLWAEIAPLIVLGLNHEQQHQELIATDIKHVLAQNPLAPAAYTRPPQAAAHELPPLNWHAFDGGIYQIGREAPAPETAHEFAYDNEGPRHEALIRPFALASRLVTNGEFRDFIDDGGYRRADLWLSDGWAAMTANGREAPLYWRPNGDSAGSSAEDSWREFTLFGETPLDAARPVSHVSYYEACAFAAWAGKRLPSEAELEIASRDAPLEGNFLDANPGDGSGPRGLHPEPAAPQTATNDGLAQLYGDVWEWTSSAYGAYPGFRAASGAVGEYNGKFMCNQFVLRGGSCATPRGHIRPTYRNFFPAAAQWQVSGVRLADDL